MLLPYLHADDIAGSSEVVIVEGEVDKLALEEAGIKNVVSVSASGALCETDSCVHACPGQHAVRLDLPRAHRCQTVRLHASRRARCRPRIRTPSSATFGTAVHGWISLCAWSSQQARGQGGVCHGSSQQHALAHAHA